MSMADDTDKRMAATERSAAGPAIILIFGIPFLAVLAAELLGLL
jgi:hypothetical protein